MAPQRTRVVPNRRADPTQCQKSIFRRHRCSHRPLMSIMPMSIHRWTVPSQWTACPAMASHIQAAKCCTSHFPLTIHRIHMVGIDFIIMSRSMATGIVWFRKKTRKIVKFRHFSARKGTPEMYQQSRRRRLSRPPECYECLEQLQHMPLYQAPNSVRDSAAVADNVYAPYDQRFGLSKKGLLQIDYSLSWMNLQRLMTTNKWSKAYGWSWANFGPS